MTLVDRFSKVAEKIANAMGHPVTFAFALGLIIGWASFGPRYGWSDQHSMFINTTTTIVTFLLGFLILNTANRSGKAEQLKLDELIRAVDKANNNYVKLEQKTAKEMKELEEKMKHEANVEEM